MPPPRPAGAGDSATVREIMEASKPKLPAYMSPEMQTGGSPGLSGQTAPGAVQPPDELSEGLNKITAAQAHTGNVESWRPKQQEPKWWERALAGAVGGAAGYTNAAGRVHVDPTA